MRSPSLRVLGDLAAFLIWNLGLGLALFGLPWPADLGVALLLTFLFLHGYLLRGSSRLALLRLEPLGPALPAVALAVPGFLALFWGLNEVYLHFVPVPVETLNPFEVLTGSPEGRFAVAVLAIGIAPIVEEFVFRGLIQGRIEARWGPLAGIGVSSLLFALVHLLPWVLPLHFLLGVAFGVVVWASRSIWAGVLLHAANNVAAVFGLTAVDGPVGRPTVWETGIVPSLWINLLLALGGGAVFVAATLRLARLRAGPKPSAAG